MSLGLNTFCAPSAGSAAWISVLLPWGAVMDVCPQSMNAGAGASLKLKQERPHCVRKEKVVWARKPILYSVVA